MKKQFVKILSLCVLGATTVFVSCKDNNDDEKPEVKIAKRVYILNEGNWGDNNATLDAYYPGDSTFQGKITETANGEALGDLGQDALLCGNSLYVCVSGSKYLAKTDFNGKIVERYSFTEADGQPRYLAEKDGFIYVSTYGGKVMKFDTTAIVSPKVSVEVGPNPEQICIKGDALYVAIAGPYGAYQNKVAVVDLTNFSFKENIEVAVDPTNVLAAGEKLYVIHYDTAMWTQEILEVDPIAKTFSVLCPGAKMATDGESLYYVNSVTDWTTYATTTSFVKKDLKTKADSKFLDLTSAPELESATVYMFEIDPDNGDFYIGTTDYKTNGTVYRFGKDGKFIAKFATSSINPNKAVFLK